MAKTTTHVLEGLLMSSDSIEDFLTKNQDDCNLQPFHYELRRRLHECQVAANELYRLVDLDQSFCYQLLSGKRKPSRDTVMRIAIGLKSDMAAANALLKYAGHQPFYARNPRDATIMHGLVKGMSIMDINQKLSSLEISPL